MVGAVELIDLSEIVSHGQLNRVLAVHHSWPEKTARNAPETIPRVNFEGLKCIRSKAGWLLFFSLLNNGLFRIR